MTRPIRFGACVVAGALAFAVRPSADAPHIYAIHGARLVTASGAPVPSGTIVLRNGLIDAVGADVAVPSDATVIDGAGMMVAPNSPIARAKPRTEPAASAGYANGSVMEKKTRNGDAPSVAAIAS